MKRAFEFNAAEIPLIIGLHLSNQGVQLKDDEILRVGTVVDTNNGKLISITAVIEKRE